MWKTWSLCTRLQQHPNAGEGETGEDDWTWNTQRWEEQQPEPETGWTTVISPETASDYPGEYGPKIAVRDCTGKPVEDTDDKYLVLEGPLRTCCQCQRWRTPDTKSLSRKINCTCGIPGTGRWQHIRRARGTTEVDVALEPLATAPRISK